MAAKTEKLQALVEGQDREALKRVGQVLDAVTDAAVEAWADAAADTVIVFQDLLGREATTGDADAAKLAELAELLKGDFQSDRLRGILRGQLLEILSDPEHYFAMANAAGRLQEIAVMDDESRIRTIRELLVCLGFGDKVSGKVNEKKAVARNARLKAALKEAPSAALSVVTRDNDRLAKINDRVEMGGYADVRDLLMLPYLRLAGEVMVAAFHKALEADDQARGALAGLRQHGTVFRKITREAQARAQAAQKDVEAYNRKRAAYEKLIEDYRSYGLIKEGEPVPSDLMQTMLEQVYGNLTETRRGYDEQMKLRDKVRNVHPPKVAESVQAVAGAWDTALNVQDMIASIYARRDSWVRVGLVSIQTAAALEMALVTVTNHLITSANDRQIAELKDTVKTMLRFVAEGRVGRSRAYAQAHDLLPKPTIVDQAPAAPSEQPPAVS